MLRVIKGTYHENFPGMVVDVMVNTETDYETPCSPEMTSLILKEFGYVLQSVSGEDGHVVEIWKER